MFNHFPNNVLLSSFTLVEPRGKKRDPLKQYSIISLIRHALGFDLGCVNTELSTRKIDGPLIPLWFTDQGKGRRAWWRSADPGHSLSGLSDSQNEMRLGKEHHKRCLWKACNVQQRSYTVGHIYKTVHYI